MTTKVLFVCTDCRLRSPTAAEIYRDRSDLNVDCGGLGDLTHHPVTEEMIQLADVIFVMERRHVTRMTSRWPVLTADKQIINLGIPDKYDYMQPELIDLLRGRLAGYLGS